MKILINHIGYKKSGNKKAILQAPPHLKIQKFHILEKAAEAKVFEGNIQPAVYVANWRDRYFFTMDFTEFSTCGSFYIQITVDSECITSHEFTIEDDPYLTGTLADILDYFVSQRCTGIYDEADRSMSFFGSRKHRVDVHGGWYDASGDVSKYLSHLSYANYLNPQQTPLVVWNLLYAHDLLDAQKSISWKYLPERIIAEAIHGADFLVRMQDKEGYFYMTVFDGWSARADMREICAYTDFGKKSEDYQAAYRQGGGLAIAALARASTLDRSGDYDAEKYLETARKGFAHLEKHNLRYVDDGKENIIDDYCALLAASEIFNACKEEQYLKAAGVRARSLIARISDDRNYSGWWRADETGERPYFHAAEAGLPVVSLIRFLEVAENNDLREKILAAIRKSLDFELKITGEVVNPFGYARQYIKPLPVQKKTAFFFPHDNESGYWWQGENARLASLATASSLASQYFADDKALLSRLKRFSQDQIDWILGLNPFDICMLHGKGRNNPEYPNLKGLKNVKGGICNGITSGVNSEDDIEFSPDKLMFDYYENWRWSEQWLPHAAWFFLAVCAGALYGRDKF
ncbi:MAG: glycoside hydrolase family 9 protein [Spirochaetales bacterium]|nr:glycoside hydrolase family 9 protein [Spirochaetales bacterium]